MSSFRELLRQDVRSLADDITTKNLIKGIRHKHQTNKTKTTQKSHFFHFITLIQTRSKGGPLLSREDDAVILKEKKRKRKETNIRSAG